MWIFLWIILALLALLSLILLLPVSIIIKADDSGKPTYKFKVLFITINPKTKEKDKPESTVAKSLKESLGLDKLNKDTLKKSSFRDTLSQTFSLVTSLLKTITDLAKHFKIKKLKLHIVCGEDDAAQTAITYGWCCAVAYPFLGFLHSVAKIRKKGEEVNISCDYEAKKNHYLLELVLSVRIFRILTAFLKAAYNHSKKQNNPEK